MRQEVIAETYDLLLGYWLLLFLLLEDSYFISRVLTRNGSDIPFNLNDDSKNFLSRNSDKVTSHYRAKQKGGEQVRLSLASR